MTHPNTAARHLHPVDGPEAAIPEPPPDEDPPPAPTGGRRVTLTPAAGIRLRPTYWLWDGRIPHGALTIGPGREGIGKSLFCAWLAARVTLGELPGLHLGQPRGVIYAATEDSWERTLAGRLIAAGADMQRVYRVEVEHVTGHTLPLSLPRDCDALAGEMAVHDIGLLVVDPLMSVVDATINVNQDRDLRGALEPLVRLADTAECAIFGLAHFNKASGTDVLSRITGSRAFSAVARAAIAFARDTTSDDGTCVISQAKNNLGSLDLPSYRYTVESVELDTDEGPASWGRLVMLGETDVHVNELLDDAPPAKGEASERDEVRTWLREYLRSQGGSAPAADITEQGHAAGMYSKDQLKRAKTDIGARSVKDGTAWVWRLDEPDDTKGAREQERKGAGVRS
ncbi:AAA family ATPase [Saccharomonospora sp. CUA-673]|uniref:AAA family ATPase n=1 Tax=Saccharomonospora sp. CUA-673 TaxID=1904969 RepID=UPI0009FB1DFD|nr:AAA family ATPase [Saccharomonospora sp. CUA-673]